MAILQKQKQQSEHNSEERRKLLAMVHIAREELALSDAQYRLMLDAAFDVPTAAALTDDQLRIVIRYFIQKYDWKPKGKDKTPQMSFLQQRALLFARQIPGGPERAQGLCRKLCDVDKIQWCNDIPKLKRLLAAMGNIARTEGASSRP